MTTVEAIMRYLQSADHIPSGTAIARAINRPTSTTYRALASLERAGRVSRQRVAGYAAIDRPPRPTLLAPCLQSNTPAPLAAFYVSQGAGL